MISKLVAQRGGRPGGRTRRRDRHDRRLRHGRPADGADRRAARTGRQGPRHHQQQRRQRHRRHWPRCWARTACARSSARSRGRWTRRSSTACTAAAGSSWSWCRRATWPNASAPPAPASAPSSRPRATARRWPRAKNREINGRQYVLEYPLHADYALIKAERGDRWGNLVYRKTARNFGPIMASAARVAVAQVREIVELGELDPRTWSPPASSCNAWCGSTPPRPPRNNNEPKQTEPRRDRRARRPRHSRRRLREPGYRPADPGRQPPAGRPRSHPAHRNGMLGMGPAPAKGEGTTT